MTIRLATPNDLPALGRLGALLMRTHYEFDPQRFMNARTDAAEGYAWFLGRQLKDQDVVIYVAEQDGEVFGYVYAGIEPISWKSEEHTSELQSQSNLVCRLLLEKKNSPHRSASLALSG